MTAADDVGSGGVPARTWLRPAIGSGQGLALWLLYSAADAKTWPATDPYLFTPLLLSLLFVPIAAAAALGALRRRTLALWVAIALLFTGGAGLHESLRAVYTTPADLVPRAGVFGAVALALFIAQALIIAGDSDRRLIANYPTYFDIAWKHQVQLLLSLLFFGLFWAVLWLGAELFRLIGIEQLRKLIV